MCGTFGLVASLLVLSTVVRLAIVSSGVRLWLSDWISTVLCGGDLFDLVLFVASGLVMSDLVYDFDLCCVWEFGFGEQLAFGPGVPTVIFEPD